jgi:hypothetical protein
MKPFGIFVGASNPYFEEIMVVAVTYPYLSTKIASEVRVETLDWGNSCRRVSSFVKPLPGREEESGI